MDEKLSRTAAAILVIISLIALYLIRVANGVSAVARIALALAMLVGVGIVVQRLLKLKGGYGLYMIGGKRGISSIDNTARKHNAFWDAMSMWGLTLGFGILTYPLMKGKIDKRVYVFGLVSLFLITIFILPNLGSAMQFINLPQIQNALAGNPTTSLSLGGLSVLGYIIDAITVFTGFSGLLFALLFISTESILWGVVQFTFAPSQAAATGITNQLGVAPIIPGIDVPFLAGIGALIILLTIHEFSHGVLARKAKVKLQSIGVLVFGSVPIGGFVEPDEKMVEKLDNVKQTKIFSAGIAANFIAMVVFFVLMSAMIVYVLPSVFQYRVVVASVLPNYPANGVLKSGMQIIKWNNYTILGNINNLTLASAHTMPNSTVTVVANTSTYSFKAVPSRSNSSKGIIGVSLGTKYLPIKPSLYSSFVYFLYTLFALSMLLNFFVAAINLLPIPGFDGWRIYYANIKKEKFIKFMAALVIILIIVNILPVFFYL